MQLRFFAIPATDPAAAEAALNRVLAAGRVVSLERQFVADGAASFWALCVTLAPGPGELPAALKGGGGRRLDYREVLDEADFAVFARLRMLRKEVAEAEAVPPYAVFTNEQLAAMVTGRVADEAGNMVEESVAFTILPEGSELPEEPAEDEAEAEGCRVAGDGAPLGFAALLPLAWLRRRSRR